MLTISDKVLIQWAIKNVIQFDRDANRISETLSMVWWTLSLDFVTFTGFSLLDITTFDKLYWQRFRVFDGNRFLVEFIEVSSEIWFDTYSSLCHITRIVWICSTFLVELKNVLWSKFQYTCIQHLMEHRVTKLFSVRNAKKLVTSE